ncbi:MAG TPA: hypothetical protein PKZ97_02975 [Azospirillaceae bacterium]|nr:hypothetical protein [Azospirillaceae bacterium]HRQ80058.1 hypothetical protein [Azospirillaceae bacterium]
MSVTPGDLLAEAKALRVAARGSEARCRTVIGRAYYAAYHALSQAAATAGYRYATENNRPPGSHENLIHWCRSQKTIPALKMAGRILADIKTWRVRADYKLADPVTYDITMVCLDNAQALIDDLAPA